MKGHEGPTIPFRRRALYTGILVLAGLLLCESGLRVRAWIRYGGPAGNLRDTMMTYDPKAELYVAKPGFEVRGARVNIRINSLGFRGDEISVEKPPNTIRIAVLGASSTFNAEVSANDKTWPHRLQAKLRAAYPGVGIEVVNTAMGGYVSTDNLKNLRHRVLPLAPDLVIYYEAHNEIVKDTGELARQQGLIATVRRSPLARVLASYSLMFDLVHKNLIIVAGDRGGPSTKLDAVPPELTNHFIGVLDEINTELSSRNVPLMLSTFIVKYRRNQDRATQIANADVAFYYMPWLSMDGMLNAMDVYNAAILGYAARKGLVVVDDREAVPPDAEHFADCMHVLDKGAEAMAERFMRVFQDKQIIEQLAGKNGVALKGG